MSIYSNVNWTKSLELNRISAETKKISLTNTSSVKHYFVLLKIQTSSANGAGIRYFSHVNVMKSENAENVCWKYF